MGGMLPVDDVSHGLHEVLLEQVSPHAQLQRREGQFWGKGVT
jgi:hypothetical protein